MKRSMLLIGPAAAIALALVLTRSGMPAPAVWTAGVTTLTALWWVFEPIPIPATSLIPLAVFPLVGVLTAEQVGAAYGSKMILLLMGGLMLSSAMERSGAHRRLALGMVSLLGGASGRRLVFGFMAASAVLSMWISNTATTLMMLPIALAVLEKVKDSRLSVALLLGVAYAASVGGIGTPIGTPPNLIFMQKYSELAQKHPELIGGEVSFLQWMSWALPIVVVMVPLVGFWLTRGLKKSEAIELPAVGVWRAEEVRTLLVFAATACLWITRTEPWGGWSGLLNLPSANDASVALLAAVVMFLIPNGKGGRLLDWKTASSIPWGVLLLFSSGVVIASAFESSGLSDTLGKALAGLSHLPAPVLIGLICLGVTFLTEVTSNTASTNLLMPILAATATSAGFEPRQLMVPATISASFAFMLPVATPPNAIVFSSGKLSIKTMAREGLYLNLIGAVVVTTVCVFLFE